MGSVGDERRGGKRRRGGLLGRGREREGKGKGLLGREEGRGREKAFFRCVDIVMISSPSPGAVMALVFVFFLPTGALLSRYYQAVFSAWLKVQARRIPRPLVGETGMEWSL